MPTSATRFRPVLACPGHPKTHYPMWRVQRGVERLRGFKSERLSLPSFPPSPSVFAYKNVTSLRRVKCLCLLREIRSCYLHVYIFRLIHIHRKKKERGRGKIHAPHIRFHRVFKKFFQLCTHRTAFAEASRQTGRLNASIFTSNQGPSRAYTTVYRGGYVRLIPCTRQ